MASIQGVGPFAALLVPFVPSLRQHVGSILPDHRHSQVLERGPGLQSFLGRIPLKLAACGPPHLRLWIRSSGGLDT